MVAGVALAAVFVTHAISAVILAVLLAIILLTFLGTEGWQARMVPDLIGAFILACGLAAFWLVPAFAHNDLRGALTSWDNPPLAERLADLLAGRLLFHGLLVWLLLAGWLFAVHRFQQRQPWALALVVTPFAYLWVADLFLRWDPNNVVSMQLANRGLGYVGVLAVLPFAALLAGATTQLGDRRGWHVAGEVVAIVGAALLVVGIGGALRGQVIGQQTPAPMLRELAVQLAAHVPDGARFVTQRDFPNERRITGVSHPDFWLPWASGRDTLNLFNIESSTTGWPGHVADHLTEQPPEVAADELARLGVTHIAVINDQAAQPLLASSRFPRVWRSPPMALLAVSPRQGQPAPGSLLSTPVAAEARLVRAEAQHLVIEARTGQPISASIAVAWSPKWHARVNGHTAALGRSANGLLMLSLPAGTSTIELLFGPDLWDVVGTTLTALALAVLAGLVWRRRRGTQGRSVAEDAGKLDVSRS
jgi:6-pyruvoyl-tetrahydropterin synthase related domain